MRRSATILLLALAAALLTACGPASTPAATTATTPSATSDPATPTPSPTNTPSISAVVIAHDGVSFVREDEDERFSFEEGDAIVAAITELAGAEPQVEIVDGYGGWAPDVIRHTWGDVTVSVLDGSQSAWITVLGASVDGIPVRTVGGIAVGSARADVLAAGGEDGWDEDSDGVPDELYLDAAEVPGTQSLVTPGTTGREYVSVRVAQDVVTVITSPANDFSDL